MVQASIIVSAEVNVADNGVAEDAFVAGVFRVRAVVAHVVPLLVVAQK